MKFYTFVETLGSYITDQDNVTRENGITVLSSVLSQLSQDYLTESELHFVIAFYCDRMKDHYTIIPSVLNGILAIVRTSACKRYSHSVLFYFILTCNFVPGKYDSFTSNCIIISVKNHI